jgi:S-DNA-T family DNA segregation ATPase FtsK/SpoIIIE
MVIDAEARQQRLEAAAGVQIIDAETMAVESAESGGSADPAPERLDLYATVTWRRDDPRPPVVPAWMLNRAQRRLVARLLAREAGYHAAFHATRLPLYGMKIAVYAPRGAARLTGRTVRWASAHDAWALAQRAATVDDRAEWMALDQVRQRQSSWRVPLLLAMFGAAVVAGAVVTAVTPWWVCTALSVSGVSGLARIGRPADRPILVRTVNPRRFTRLTAEMVREALVRIGVPGVREPGDIDFPAPGIHRDGPGWLARVNLPGGVKAVKVLERREELSSALRLPVDQVWPDAGPEHAGQVDLWVGYQPASKMGQPRWSLTDPTARTSFFEPFEFGTDQRQRPQSITLAELNVLIGGQPGSGKSFGARTLAGGAVLDPLVELIIAEFKGTADFGDLAHLCSTYVCGVDDAAFERASAVVEWGLAECERRGRRIRKARERGECPKGKITPELAARPGSGLHPIVIIIDEAHELFGALPEAGKAMERLIKRGRALGITVVLATQIPDKDSLPPIITRCVAVRWCMSVSDQVANDMILGTGAYKRGLSSTGYRPKLDAGWGVMVGLGTPGSVRAQYPADEDWRALVERATQLRGGRVVGGSDEAPPPRDVLEDLRTIWVPSERGQHWTTLAERLTERWPDAYASLTAEALSSMARGLGLPSVDVKARGERTPRKGCRAEAIEAAIQAREIEAD